MREIRRAGDMPKVLLPFGLMSEEAQAKLVAVTKNLPYEIRSMVTAEFVAYECNSLTEFATVAELDDCSKGIIVDRVNDRYYLCALTIDPGRKRSRIEDTEYQDNDVVEDTATKPARVLYFLPVSHRDYKAWHRADRLQRQQWWNDRVAREKEVLAKQSKLDGKIVSIE
jgi:hypothetical protein